jgi:UDP-glucose 4-epimerase|tara:strand:+ start:33 stop:884 length:852 start_codon:yes stop_codon:yes gene_type:complete
MKILVTGGAGGVGTNLIEKLLELGHEVTSWDNYSAGLESNHIEGATYINRDTREMAYGSGPGTIKDFDLVYHLGEYSKVVPSFDCPELSFRYNLEGSMRVLESCRHENIPVIYAGSSTKLSYPGELGSPYALYKSTVAKLFQCYGDWYDLKYNICYFYNVYGPRTETWANEWQTVINIFRDQKKAGKNLTITGDGTQKRDFTHVEDIVQGLVLAGENINNEEYQLGTGEEFSILEIAKAFDHPHEFIDPRPGDRPNGLADISFTKERLGYKPKHRIMDYIKSI